MRKIPKILTCAATGLIVVALSLALTWRYYLGAPDAGSASTVIFTVKNGEGLPDIAENLKKQGLIRNNLVFIAVAFIDGKFNKFYSGDYVVGPGMNVRQVMAVLNTPPPPVVEVTVLLKEGWTTGQYARVLEHNGVCEREEFVDIVRNPEASGINTHAAFGMKLDHLEGFLFPDTYRFQQGECLKAVKRMLMQFFQHFTPNHEDKAKALGLTPFQAVVLASIVEKETRAPVELERVAGVFLKRLKNNWKLEADATFKYLDGEWDPEMKISDPRARHAYNTYLIQGLPPRPIGNPGARALDATVNPERNTPYWYFVTKNDGTHQHFFSVTKQQHDHFIQCSNYNQTHEKKICLDEAR